VVLSPFPSCYSYGDRCAQQPVGQCDEFFERQMTPKQPDIVASLRQRIRVGLVLGSIQVGDRLPGVRDLATEFGVNPRVILSVCERLEREGLLERRDRSGIYVASVPDLLPPSSTHRAGWFVDVLLEAMQRGLSPPQFAHELLHVLTTGAFHALVLECNDDQLWSLSDELRRDYGMRTTTIDLAELAADPSLARGIDVNLVVTTAPHRDAAAKVAATLGVPMYAVTMCPELFAEVRLLLRTRRVFFIVSDRRMARKLEGVFVGRGERKRLNVLVSGEDDLTRIPATAPVYVTRLTRTRALPPALRDRGLPEARVFSPESSREMLSIVVDRGLQRAVANEDEGEDVLGDAERRRLQVDAQVAAAATRSRRPPRIA